MTSNSTKVSLVTGASRGIGRATAVRLAADGGRIALGGRDREALEATAQAVAEAGGEPLILTLDVTSAESVKEGVTEVVTRWGGIDHLVNNAGMTRDGLLMRSRPDDWDAVIDTNLGGVYRVSKEVISRMLRARSGKIVNLSSVIGETGNPGQTVYSASKAGIIGFSKSLAREVASRGITVNCVAPGLIKTEMTDTMPEQARDELLGRVPLGRAGSPEDVAAAIRFLLSADASYITGAVIRVNGGLYM
jgi:3-oxoacyl-[acyl-carrier protein] reductase